MSTLNKFLENYGPTKRESVYAIRALIQSTYSQNKNESWFQEKVAQRNQMLKDSRYITAQSLIEEAFEIDSELITTARLFTPIKGCGIYFSLINYRVKLLTRTPGVSINNVYIPLKELKYKDPVTTSEPVLELRYKPPVEAEKVSFAPIKTKETTVKLLVEIPASDVGRFILENKHITFTVAE